MSHTYKYLLQAHGFKEVPSDLWNKENRFIGYVGKKRYVEGPLALALKESETGWDDVTYHIMTNAEEQLTEEFIALHESKYDGGTKYINVTANSLGAIALECFKEAL